MVAIVWHTTVAEISDLVQGGVKGQAYYYHHFFGLFFACETWVGWGAGQWWGCGQLARRGVKGRGCARGPSLYVQVGFEAISSWKQHTLLT